MIVNQLAYRCDLCGEGVPKSLCYRVQHLVDNSDLENIRAAGIELVSTQDNGTIAFEAASDKVVCLECCETIRKTTGGGRGIKP